MKIYNNIHKNPNIPLYYIHLLAKSNNNWDRLGIVLNPKCPYISLKLLVNDKYSDIRFLARHHQNFINKINFIY